MYCPVLMDFDHSLLYFMAKCVALIFPTYIHLMLWHLSRVLSFPEFNKWPFTDYWSSNLVRQSDIDVTFAVDNKALHYTSSSSLDMY